jgi:hypothetical protein
MPEHHRRSLRANTQLAAEHNHAAMIRKQSQKKSKQLPIQLAAERVISKRYSRGMEDQEGKTKKSESALHRSA